jgi:hypothetical protein
MVAIWCLLTTGAQATTWFVDSKATGAKNGTSWTNAWSTLQQVSGVQPGDTVYISGGPSGASQTYTGTTNLHLPGGAAGKPVTYQIGQDAAHNGTAMFNWGNQNWLQGAYNYVVVSGDAGDGKMHFSLVAARALYTNGNNSSNVRLAYINLPDMWGEFCYFKSDVAVGGLEIDHCYMKKPQGASDDPDHAIYISVKATGFDQGALIHDNKIIIPNSGNGTGDDGIQGGGTGVSIYNNTIEGYIVPAYPRGQHQDGWQPLGGSYYKFCNNTCLNIANYPCFGDGYYANFSHFWVYNNVIVLASSVLQNTDPPQGIAIGPDGGDLVSGGSMVDIRILNNLIDGYHGHASIALWRPPTAPRTSFVNCTVANNVLVNGASLQLDPAVANVNNVVGITTAQAQIMFVRYAANSTTNDYHLTANAFSLIMQGANESGYFTIDKDRHTRAATEAWDIGPYKR